MGFYLERLFLGMAKSTVLAFCPTIRARTVTDDDFFVFFFVRGFFFVVFLVTVRRGAG